MFLTGTTWARANMYGTAHGYVILGGFKVVTNLKEKKEAKCNFAAPLKIEQTLSHR